MSSRIEAGRNQVAAFLPSGNESSGAANAVQPYQRVIAQAPSPPHASNSSYKAKIWDWIGANAPTRKTQLKIGLLAALWMKSSSLFWSAWFGMVALEYTAEGQQLSRPISNLYDRGSAWLSSIYQHAQESARKQKSAPLLQILRSEKELDANKQLKICQFLADNLSLLQDPEVFDQFSKQRLWENAPFLRTLTEFVQEKGQSLIWLIPKSASLKDRALVAAQLADRVSKPEEMSKLLTDLARNGQQELVEYLRAL